MLYRSMLRLLAGAFSVLVVLALVGTWFVFELTRVGPLLEERTVVVVRGTGTVQIAQQLTEAGVSRWSPLFVAAAAIGRVTAGYEPRAGEYLFAPGVSVLEVFEQMRHGRTVVHRLTVVEGVTVAQVVALIKAEPGLIGEITELPREGSLLPDTYHFALGDSRLALLQRMQAAMNAAITEMWSSRVPGSLLLNPSQAVVLASIVEKETALPAERPRIAGVFLNRLATGMRLQSDPTVVYALTGGKGALGRPLTRADWRFESPINTYHVDGLPPGPIGNPGRASLLAVLHPEHHDYLYFVADGHGGHAFAKSLAEHNENVVRWHQVQHGPSEQK
ncbi:MAG: endolytic transglycosylase MltG [Rhodospirillaceae bacterium]